MRFLSTFAPQALQKATRARDNKNRHVASEEGGWNGRGFTVASSFIAKGLFFAFFSSGLFQGLPISSRRFLHRRAVNSRCPHTPSPIALEKPHEPPSRSCRSQSQRSRRPAERSCPGGLAAASAALHGLSFTEVCFARLRRGLRSPSYWTPS